MIGKKSKIFLSFVKNHAILQRHYRVRYMHLDKIIHTEYHIIIADLSDIWNI